MDCGAKDSRSSFCDVMSELGRCCRRELANHRADAMDGVVKSQIETDEDILTFDIPDGALERAANVEQASTWAYCTHPWYYCPWPQ